MSGLLRYSAPVKLEVSPAPATKSTEVVGGERRRTGLQRTPLSSLAGQAHPLSTAAAQRARLQSVGVEAFESTVARQVGETLCASTPRVLQLNLGRLCQQACRHCHVDAAPDRSEQMTDTVIDAALLVLEQARIPTLDLTGGAPELHPRVQELMLRGRALGARVLLRCNLTLLITRPFEAWPDWLARQGVEIIASMPHYLPGPTDAQRGPGAFERSIAALRRLNAAGYGLPDSALRLNLVSNPSGALLPGRQSSLEREFRRELQRHQVQFHALWVMANMPISRFLAFLVDSGTLEPYLKRLEAAFNPQACTGLMCRDTLSVAWNGELFDCDFNQMLELPLSVRLEDLVVDGRLQRARWDAAIVGRAIQTAVHCYGCTAGGGSSCSGATTTDRKEGEAEWRS